jgi:hypothetical protein
VFARWARVRPESLQCLDGCDAGPLLRLDQSFFQDIMPTIRAFRRLLEDVIEGDRRAVWIAVVA